MKGLCIFTAMSLEGIWESIVEFAAQLQVLDSIALVFGVLAVLFLVRQNIWTWPTGIIYTVVTLVVFWEVRFYAQVFLHVIFLSLNIYGWYYWIYGKKEGEKELPVTRLETRTLMILPVFLLLVTLLIWYILQSTDANEPVFDSVITTLSILGIWLQARKKIESWVVWIINDLIAINLYWNQELYFYFLLYLLYIGMAVSGIISWRKSMIASSGSV